ncbi:MAG: hypothetical protein US70_C0005G0018 [Parcubacteria group bacterium GW2011_GWD2_38_11]|nr:MAG: hypothetical protein US70_C0005G0018 [Parcubacteria group bacterium GW2011_GWD2_38_11]
MQFDFKLNFKKATVTEMQIIPAIGLFWRKRYKSIFLVFLVTVIILSAYIWQRSLSGGEWSPEKKQEYLNAQNKGVIFNENNFKKALADIEMRKQDIADEQKQARDIFKAY